MKPFTSHNFKLDELVDLRNYNSKTFKIPATKERLFYGRYGISKSYHGDVLTEIHAKPIHYLGHDQKWHDLDEVAVYYGNKNGMILKPGWENKIDMRYLGAYLKRNLALGGKGIQVLHPAFKEQLVLNLNATIFSEVGDGYVQNNGATYATVNSASSGSSAVYTNVGEYMQNNWNGTEFVITRLFFAFDLTAYSGISTSAATFSLFQTNDAISNVDTDSASVTQSSQASTSSLVTADYSRLTSTKYGSDILFSDITLNAYNDWAGNATMRTDIDTAGGSFFKCSARNAKDISATQPTSTNYVRFYMSEQAGTSNDPKLALTYTLTASLIPTLLFLGVG